MQKLVIEAYKELDYLEWPRLEENIKKSLIDLESLVNECVEKKLTGHEQDKSDLNNFKIILNNLKQQKCDLGQKLLDSINGRNYHITDRHAEKNKQLHILEILTKISVH